MARTKDDTPIYLQPLVSNGIDFQRKVGEERVADCPFCGKEDKLYANENSGLWECKSCGENGNPRTFLEKMSQIYAQDISDKETQELSLDRSLPWPTLKVWGIGFNGTDWTIPIRNASGSIQDIRTYNPRRRKGKMRSTRGVTILGGSCLFGAEQLQDKALRDHPIFICEGEWDAIAMDWLLAKLSLEGICVAVPGAGTFKREWVSWFTGRNVIICYDNDDAGDNGSAKVGRMISSIAASVQFLCWPEELPDGHDLRDHIVTVAIGGKKPKGCWKSLQKLIGERHRRVDDGIDDGRQHAATTTHTRLTKRREMTYSELIKEYRRWLLIDPRTELAIKLMLSTVLTSSQGEAADDPAWLYIVGPAGCGKTTILSSLRFSDHCIFRSSITPKVLVSGMNTGGATSDPSLIPKLNGKCLVLKDFTEVLGQPFSVQEELYSILRGAYDGELKKDYGNGVYRNYESRFNMVAGVTHRIHGNERASLGERFIKYDMVPKPEKGENWNHSDTIRRAIRNVGKSTKNSVQLAERVADFIEDRWERAANLTPIFDPPFLLEKLINLASLVEGIRSQVERDFRGDIIRMPRVGIGTRVATQLVKLALGIQIVLGKDRIDQEVWDIITETAFNTAVGFNLTLIHAIMAKGGRATREELHEITGMPKSTVWNTLEDLEMLDMVTKKIDEEMVELKPGRKHFRYRVRRQLRVFWKQALI